MRFSVTRYSFRSRSSWSTDPVMYASNRFQSMVALPQLGRSVLMGVWVIAWWNARQGARAGGFVTTYRKVSSNNLTKRDERFPPIYYFSLHQRSCAGQFLA